MTRKIRSRPTQHGGHQIEQKSGEPGLSSFVVIVAGMLFMVALGAGQYFKSMGTRAMDRFQLMQFEDMQTSVYLYAAKYSEPPPNMDLAQIENHLREHYPQSPAIQDFIDELPTRLKDLDEKECLAFWLGAQPWNPDSKSHIPCIGEDQVVDSDNDGWPEYVDCRNCIFIIRDGILRRISL